MKTFIVSILMGMFSLTSMADGELYIQILEADYNLDYGQIDKADSILKQAFEIHEKENSLNGKEYAALLCSQITMMQLEDEPDQQRIDSLTEIVSKISLENNYHTEYMRALLIRSMSVLGSNPEEARDLIEQACSRGAGLLTFGQVLSYYDLKYILIAWLYRIMIEEDFNLAIEQCDKILEYYKQVPEEVKYYFFSTVMTASAVRLNNIILAGDAYTAGTVNQEIYAYFLLMEDVRNKLYKQFDAKGRHNAHKIFSDLYDFIPAFVISNLTRILLPEDESLSNPEEREYTEQEQTDINVLQWLLYYSALLKKGLLLQLDTNENTDSSEFLSTESCAEEVRKTLLDDEVAIEFLQIADTETDSIAYLASVIVPDGATFYQVFITDKDGNIDGVSKEEYLTTTKLHDLIWEPLKMYIPEAKTIYFSPDGILHNIPIEYLPCDEAGTPFCDAGRKVYRLSSTRELAKRPTKRPIMQLAMFGNLTYDSDIPAELRGLTFGSLKYSKEEIDQIGDICQRTGISAAKYQREQGTETRFKQISGTAPSIIHLSTHAFYIEEPEEKRALRPILASFFNSSSHDPDRDMLLSGLVFSGAEKAMGDIKAPDDGILYSQEVAQLDFRNTDLVVLSACQTGTGVIGGDGVFGLQRGFKMAGAKALICSLKRVNDKDASLLMEEFYHLLLEERQDIYEALAGARRKMRDENRDRPDSWANFILIDGLPNERVR